MQPDVLKNRIAAVRGDVCADLVLKNARVINVFTNEIETADIAISGNYIVGVGEYRGRKEVDLRGSYVCPGLIDGHIHIESSMLCGTAFEQAVLPHGTTAIITDPHEISNVAGLDGLEFMLETTKDLTLSVYFMLPSCVPATDLDESGAELLARDLEPFYADEKVLGLAEMMNAFGVTHGDKGCFEKLVQARSLKKAIDGHAPALSGKELNAYVTAGIRSDHECSDFEEAKKCNRLESSCCRLLNGKWKFKLYKNYAYRPTDFAQPHYDAHNWDSVIVPGSWTMQGYDQNQYCNVRYPWEGHEDICPPNAPQFI